MRKANEVVDEEANEQTFRSFGDSLCDFVVEPLFNLRLYLILIAPFRYKIASFLAKQLSSSK